MSKTFGVVKSAKMRKIVRMTDTYDKKIKQMSKQLDDMITTMDLYAKYEITAQDKISESLLYSDSMKALDTAGQRLNDKHKKTRKA